jgi:hypothetical protein
MRNQYAGTCYRCGGHVAAGEGHFERNRENRSWRVQHAGCAINYRGTDKGKEGATERRRAWQFKRDQERATGTGKVAQRARARLRQMEAPNA